MSLWHKTARSTVCHEETVISKTHNLPLISNSVHKWAMLACFTLFLYSSQTTLRNDSSSGISRWTFQYPFCYWRYTCIQNNCTIQCLHNRKIWRESDNFSTCPIRKETLIRHVWWVLFCQIVLITRWDLSDQGNQSVSKYRNFVLWG